MRTYRNRLHVDLETLPFDFGIGSARQCRRVNGSYRSSPIASTNLVRVSRSCVRVDHRAQKCNSGSDSATHHRLLQHTPWNIYAGARGARIGSASLRAYGHLCTQLLRQHSRGQSRELWPEGPKRGHHSTQAHQFTTVNQPAIVCIPAPVVSSVPQVYGAYLRYANCCAVHRPRPWATRRLAAACVASVCAPASATPVANIWVNVQLF